MTAKEQLKERMQKAFKEAGYKDATEMADKFMIQLEVEEGEKRDESFASDILKRFNSAADFLSEGIIWMSSKERHNYWSDVHSTLQRKGL